MQPIAQPTWVEMHWVTRTAARFGSSSSSSVSSTAAASASSDAAEPGPETAGSSTVSIVAPFVPPPLAEQSGQTFSRLVELMQRLLAPDGCPWDREQSLPTLRRYVLEEACEVIDAIDGGDRRELCAELGDLLLQVVFQAELARAEGSFGPDDVVAAICDKLVRRHPHVFADASVSGAGEVLQNWERIKAAERAAAPQ